MAAPSRILVPIDLSEGSRTVIDYALSLARPFNATVEVVHAWEPPQYVAPDLLVAAPGWNALSLEQVALETASKELATLLQQTPSPQVPIKHRVLVGEAASTILELAEKEGHDLIIMGTHGRRGISRVLLGSVAQKIVSRAHCPVLTLHVATDKK